MTAPVVTEEKRGFRAPGTTFMVVGGLLGALGAYLFQLYGGNTMGEVAFAPVAVLWTVMFILATVLLVPVEQYVTREVASGRRAIPHDLRVSLVTAGIAAAIGGTFVAVTLNDLFEGDPAYITQIVLLMIGYSLLFVGKGVFAGTRRFAKVGWVLIVETAVRLVAAIVFVQFFASATSLGWAMVLGGFSAVGLLWWRYDSGDPSAPAAPARRFLVGYAGGTASSQVLLAGAPLAVAALGGSPALISVIFFTFTIYRAPLTLIFSLQGRILPYLVGLARDANHVQLVRIVRSVVLGGVGLVALGGVVGWLMGSDVIVLLLGEEFAPTQIVAMLTAAGVMAAATAQIASQVLVAEGRTSRLTWAWLGGLIVALLVLLASGGEPDTRVAVAFVSGELAALGLMALLSVRR